jgi:hypothetical protein
MKLLQGRHAWPRERSFGLSPAFWISKLRTYLERECQANSAIGPDIRSLLISPTVLPSPHLFVRLEEARVAESISSPQG